MQTEKAVVPRRSRRVRSGKGWPGSDFDHRFSEAGQSTVSRCSFATFACFAGLSWVSSASFRLNAPPRDTLGQRPTESPTTLKELHPIARPLKPAASIVGARMDETPSEFMILRDAIPGQLVPRNCWADGCNRVAVGGRTRPSLLPPSLAEPLSPAPLQPRCQCAPGCQQRRKFLLPS